MKYIKLGMHLFSRNSVMNSILIIQVSVVLLLLNFVVGYAVGIFSSVNTFDAAVQHNGVYFSGEAIIPGTVEDVKATQEERYMTLKNATVLSADYYDLFRYDLFALSNDGLEMYCPKLQEGQWIHNTKPEEDGTVPVVISIPINGITMGTILQINDGLRMRVVGILESPYIIDFRKGSSHMSAETLMVKTTWPVILANQDAMPSGTNGLILTNSMVFFNTNDEEVIHYNIAELKKSGFTTTLSDVKENGREAIKFILWKVLPFLIFAVSISFVGLIGCGILSVVKNTKLYSVLYMVGCTWKSCSKIILSYFGIILFVSVLFSSALFSLATNRVVFTGLTITVSYWNLLAVIITAAVFILITVIPLFMLSKISPVSLLRKSK